MLTVDDVLSFYNEIGKTIPVDWKNKDSIKKFKDASDKYAKTYNKLSNDDQSIVSETIARNNK